MTEFLLLLTHSRVRELSGFCALLFFLVFTCGLSGAPPAPAGQAVEEDEEPLFLFPEPKMAAKRDFLFAFDSGMAIIAGTGSNESDRRELDSLRNILVHEGKPLLPVIDEFTADSGQTGIVLGAPETSRLVQNFLKKERLIFSQGMEQEGYFLAMDSASLIIAGKTPRARFYGLQTLYQLLRQFRGTPVLPAVSIQDWPVLPIRGIIEDISAGQMPTLLSFKERIRKFASLKLNVYSPYIEDVVRFPSHQDIGLNKAVLEKNQLDEIILHAAKNHVEVIPLFQTLSHQDDILLLPQYSAFAEYPGSGTFNVSGQETYRLLEDLVNDVAGYFPSPFFNIGGNGGRDIGLAGSRKLVSEVGLERMIASHFNSVARSLEGKRKQVLIYGDYFLEFPELARLVSRGMWIVDSERQWDSLEYPSVQFFKKQELSYIVSPAVHDRYKLFPDFQRAIQNIIGFVQAGAKNGTIGVLTSSDNGVGGEELHEMNWFGYGFSASAAWAGGQLNPNIFLRNFMSQFYGMSTLDFQKAFVALWQINQPVREGWENGQLFWDHPFSRPYAPEELKKAEELETLGKWLVQQFQIVQGLGQVDKGMVDYLIFSALRAQWLGKKIRSAAQAASLFGAGEKAPGQDAVREAAALMKDLGNEIGKLKELHRVLWLRSNEESGFGFIGSRYDREARYFESAEKAIAEGAFPRSMLLPGGWIWTVSPAPAAPDSGYFMRTFELKGEVASAAMQARYYTSGKLFLNGEPLGDMLARDTNSATVWNKMTLVREIEPGLFKSGENILLASGAYLEPVGKGILPGMHVVLKLRMKSGEKIEIAADGSWQARRSGAEEWKPAVLPGARVNEALDALHPYVIEPELSW